MNHNVLNIIKHTCCKAGFIWLISCFVLFLPLQGKAQDTINVEEDENFVVASLFVAEPGGALYSRLGHAALHMQCPTHKLDYVFSYESEDAPHRVLAFLAGNLKMGMFAIPAQEYVDLYDQEGRGVKEYTLNLPLEAKRNLWRVLDKHVMEGFELPYDYLNRGCAHSVLLELQEGLGSTHITYGEWPEKYRLSRREIAAPQFDDSPWTRCFLSLICNGSIDDNCTKAEKVIVPTDLVDVLSHASVNGRLLIDSEPRVLVPEGEGLHKPWFTPMLLALLLLALAIVALFLHWSFMDYVLLAVQSLLGIVSVYLVFFSKLVCTEWSWLLIPLNPLPLICWKWRKHWCLPYAIVIVLWLLAMVLWPHSLTDAPYLVLALGLSLSYLNIYMRNKRNNKQIN